VLILLAVAVPVMYLFSTAQGYLCTCDAISNVMTPFTHTMVLMVLYIPLNIYVDGFTIISETLDTCLYMLSMEVTFFIVTCDFGGGWEGGGVVSILLL
jgi:hypothetical protein